MSNEYISLSTRAGFNKSLAHFRLVTSILEELTKGANLADAIDELEKKKGLAKSQIAPILNAVVVDRMGYRSLSFNLPNDTKDFQRIANETRRWNRFDIIVAYHHPQLGITLVNPKQKIQWDAIQDLNREELVVLYLKAKRETDQPLEPAALEALRSLLIGKEAKDTDRFLDPALHEQPAAAPKPKAEPKPAPRPAAAAPTPQARPTAPEAAQPEPPAPTAAPAAAGTKGGKRKVTPKYSVQVTNELFHNGNVEAWKNIIESFKTKYPGLEVDIFHDGKKVNNINALFKWGKVKHGDVILFCLSGEEIQGVAKLQRYLFEGASIRFHNFLKKDVNKVLTLF